METTPKKGRSSEKGSGPLPASASDDEVPSKIHVSSCSTSEGRGLPSSNNGSPAPIYFSHMGVARAFRGSTRRDRNVLATVDDTDQAAVLLNTQDRIETSK